MGVRRRPGQKKAAAAEMEKIRRSLSSQGEVDRSVCCAKACRSVAVTLPRPMKSLDRLPRSPDFVPNRSNQLVRWPITPDRRSGMDVIITTTAKTDEEARELLRLFNFPFPADEQKEAA
jgi:hypothetical protein